MKKLITIVIIFMATMFFVKDTIAAGVGGSVEVGVGVEDFAPLIWMCNNRILIDDNVEQGRNGGGALVERLNNYAFEGEQIEWQLLVMDKNGVEKIDDVFGTIGSEQGTGNDIEVNCQLDDPFYADLATDVLCYKDQSTGWQCGPNPNPAYANAQGRVYYEPIGPVLKITVELTDLKPNTQYQLTLNGRNGNDGNIPLGNNCANPGGPAPGYTCTWECGFAPGGTGSEGFWNFDLAAITDSNGDFTQTYYLDMPVGHYGIGPAWLFGFGFIVKEVLTPDSCNWFDYVPVLMEYGGLDWTITPNFVIDPSCNARISGNGENGYGEEIPLTEFNAQTMAYFTCTFTVETPASMYGEYYLTAEVCDITTPTPLCNIMDENEYWYFNPIIALTIDKQEVDGDNLGPIIEFGELRPGTVGYSNTVLVGNGAEPDSGVLLDMFISGTDFYDSNPSPAMCPTTNQLALTNFGYYAVQGSHTTMTDLRADAEGYAPIGYGDRFDNAFYDSHEIIQSPLKIGPYYLGNILSPGSEMALTFKLALPEPCNGNFDTGTIFFWGEAI